MKILVVENDEGFRTKWVDLLHENGNDTLSLPSLRGQTAKDLNALAFDLALVDRRSFDDKNPTDRSGEEFAIELCKLGTPAVLVTAFPPSEGNLFDLLRTGAILGIADKSVDMAEIAMCVEEFKISHRFPNCIAKFHWKERPPDHFAANDWVEVAKSAKKATAEPDEFAILFRSLIPPCAHTVELESITPGHGGASLFRARVSSGDGPVTEDVAIKYGNRTDIRSEAMRYDRHVGPLPDGVAAHLRWRKETRSLGALAYSWVGDSIEDGVPFGPNSSPSLSWRRRRSALERLFSVSLNPWYRVYRSAEVQSKNRATLIDYYTGEDGFRMEVPFLGKALPVDIAAPVHAVGDQWNFGIYGTLIDPSEWLMHSPISKAMLTRYCPCHGDLHVKNIFVLPDDSPRLIDFGDTSLGHIFRDFAALETSIRLTCGNVTELDLLKQAADCISNVSGLGEYIDYRLIDDKHADLREVLKTTTQIRRAALDAIGGQSMQMSFVEYLYALTFRMLRYASGIADEVSSKETLEQKRVRTWHALYISAKAAQQAADLIRDRTNAARAGTAE